MEKKKSLFLMVAITSTLFTLAGCGDEGGGKISTDDSGNIILPDFPETPNEKDSWEYLKDENGNIEDWTVDWYVNDSTFSWNTYGSDRVSQVIKEKTGVTIRFTSPVTDDGQKLSTLISGNKLPDLVSIQCWYPQCSQLAQQDYVYPLDALIDKWAPSMKDREQTDIWNYFKQGDGYCYGIPNFAYSNKYISDDEQMEPNGCLLVREDWYKEVEAAGIDMTNPDGFIKGCEFIKNKYSSSIPFQIGPFTTDGNTSIDWLSQYFACSFEDKDGNYVDRRYTENYKDMLKFLNECYQKGLIKADNITDKAAQIKTKISRGNVFASIVTPQDYQVAFKNCYSNGIKYIPLVLRNYKGEAPVLQDISGNGYLLTMVSNNCKRPDKVIKLLDFLYSEEGQRLVAFGVEGETFEYVDETKTSIKWTDKYLSGVNNPGSADATWVNDYGLYQMTLLMNLAYINKLKPLNGMSDSDMYIYNLKRPMMPYSYNYKPIFLKHDTSDKNYSSIMQKNTTITTKWSEYLANMISNDDYTKVYNTAINYVEKRGLTEVINFYSKSYITTKETLGVTYGWAPNRPDYKEPVTSKNGDFSKYVTR